MIYTHDGVENNYDGVYCRRLISVRKERRQWKKKKFEEIEKERQLQKIIAKRNLFRLTAYILSLIVFSIVGLLAFIPIYNVWAERLSGEAELARAESSRQIRILEAEQSKKRLKL